MAKDRTARPVSGEIMTARDIAPDRSARAATDVVDADYEVVPRVAAATDAVPPPRGVDTPRLEGMDMLRRPETPVPAAPASRGGPIFWIAGLGAVFAAFWISGGHALVLTISGVTSRVDATGMRPVLFVDGEAANDGAAAATLPPLQIRVTDNDGRITRYTLGTSDRWLSPGERFGFASRLDVPRNGVKTVSVTFAE